MERDCSDSHEMIRLYRLFPYPVTLMSLNSRKTFRTLKSFNAIRFKAWILHIIFKSFSANAHKRRLSPARRCATKVGVLIKTKYDLLEGILWTWKLGYSLFMILLLF